VNGPFGAGHAEAELSQAGDDREIVTEAQMTIGNERWAELPPQLQLLLRLARLDLTDGDVSACQTLIADHGDRMDWGSFLDQACRHKVMPLVSRNLIRYRLHWGEDGGRPVPFAWLYPAALAGNQARNLALADQFSSVIRGINRSGLRYAIRKGPVLSEHLYGDLSARRVNDLDILVDRADSDQACGVLSSLGYVQGHLTRDGAAVERFDRRTRAYWRINVNNELPFIKPGNRDLVEVFSVDLCLDIFQRNSGAHAGTRELLDRRIPLRLYGEQSFALSMPDQLIDVCAHLYKEATSLYFIEEGTDLQLQKFLDVSLVGRAVRDRGLWGEAVSTVHRYDATESTYYALYHAMLLYPDTITTAELDEIKPRDTAFLQQYGGLDGKPQTWKKPFHLRLSDPDRRWEPGVSSTVPRV
jgi:hypothetical protein